MYHEVTIMIKLYLAHYTVYYVGLQSWLGRVLHITLCILLITVKQMITEMYLFYKL